MGAERMMPASVVIDEVFAQRMAGRMGEYCGTLKTPEVRVDLFRHEDEMRAYVDAGKGNSWALAVSPHAGMLEAFAAAKGCRLRMFMT